MFDARTGKALTSTSSAAVRLYQDAIELILGSESGAAGRLDQALALDSNFALAAAARYYVAQDTGEPAAPALREQALQAALSAREWEREHVAVLLALIDQPTTSKDMALAYVAKTPVDLLVISKLAGNMFFFDGPDKLHTVLNLFESVEHALGDDWAFLARLGFAASEAGQRQRGRQLLQRALAIRPQALYSVHALAHLLHDEGAAAESASLLHNWLERFESSARNGQMYGHVQWHLALSEWQIGDRDAAMRRYQSYCAPLITTCGPILSLADCGGFLLREYLQSGQPRPLADAVLELIARVWDMIGHPFVALHVAGLYTSAADITGLKRCEACVAEQPQGANRHVSLLLISAFMDLVTGSYDKAAKTLAGLSPRARIGIGGSHVERILVELIERYCQTRQ